MFVVLKISKWQAVVKIVMCHLVSVRPLSERCLLSRTTDVTNANMPVTLAHFLCFLQNEGKCIEEVKIITGLDMLRGDLLFSVITTANITIIAALYQL